MILKTINRLFLLFAIVALASACSSGKKQLTKGNYEASLDLAIDRLKSSPNNRRAQQALRDAYPLAQKLHLNRIEQLKQSNVAFKWDQITESYDLLSQYHEMIQRCPACQDVLPNVPNYRTEFYDASALAVDERYEAGVMELAKETRESAIQAYRHFQRVKYLNQNYKDIDAKLDESKFYATLKVLVDQIPVHSRAFGLTHEVFQNNLFEALLGSQINEFVRFYSPAEAERENLEYPDHVVVLQFDDFVVGQVYQKDHTREISRDSVVVGQTKVEGKNVDVYGTVKAEFTTFNTYIDSGGLLDLRIFDASNDRILLQRKMPGEYQWANQWATYKGDDRALSEEEIKLTRLKAVSPPNPQYLFQQFCNPIYDQTLQHLRNFYRNY